MTPAEELHAEIVYAGGPAPPPVGPPPAGRTLFDLPGSTDLGVTVLLPQEQLHAAPSQALVRILSRDGRTYLGVVTAGPFAEPDGLRGDSQILQAVATHGGTYLPPHHGRVQVSLLGEELADGTVVPPRLRPWPNSPVHVLTDAESEKVLTCGGDVRLGLAVGHDGVEVGFPSNLKAVFPRHTAVLGTTGGGKSTTVAGLVKRAVDAGMAVVLLDVEGEYTHLHEPTDDPKMLAALEARGLVPGGVPGDRMTVYHLAGRGTANPDHPRTKAFTVQFAQLSPHTVIEILDLSDAQQERFLKAYDITKEVMRDLDVFPKKGNPEQERLALEIDEFDRGHPRLTLSMLMDVTAACLARADCGPKPKGKKAAGADDEDEACVGFEPHSPDFRGPAGKQAIGKRVNAANPPGNAISWRAVLGKLARLARLKVFYDEQEGPKPVDYRQLIQPGRLAVVDLSDSGHTPLNNLVIADILRGLRSAQDDAYEDATAAGTPPPRVLVVIEEAHEFLSDERIDRMKVLFEQVANIAKRGRKRWLGLCFVTQLPAHLPKQVLGLCNSFVLHKLTDPHVIQGLRRAVGGVDDGLWDRLPGLAAGQAVAAAPHFRRPLLVSVDPCPAKLRMAD